MLLIIIITIAIYLLVIAWTWNSLGKMEKKKKISFIFIGLLIIYLITLLVFAFSKKGIEYPEIAIEKSIRNLIVTLFTGVNAIILPLLTKQVNKMLEGEIEKSRFLKVILAILLIFFIFIWGECGYMQNTQEGILQVYQVRKQ